MCKDISHSQIGAVEPLCCIFDSRHAKLKSISTGGLVIPVYCVVSKLLIEQVPRTQYTAAPIVHSAPQLGHERGYKTLPPPSHGLLSCSPAPEQTQSTIHSRSSFSILQNTMQFYLLLALSGVISGSTVLAQEVIGYAVPGCTGATTFTYTATTTTTCSNLDPNSPITGAIELPQGVQCNFYASPGCTEMIQAAIRPGCGAADFPRTGSYECFVNQGDGN